MTLIKTCTKCGIEKVLDSYGNEKNGKYGKRGDCKECHKLLYTQSPEQKERQKLANQKYDNSEKGKVKRSEYIHSETGKKNACKRVKRFQKTDKGKANRLKHERSEKGKLTRKRYSQSEKGKAHSKITNTKYSKSDKGKEADRKKKNLRKRDLGWIPLNHILPNHDGHHINDDYIIYIPKEIHSCPHALKRPESMQEINEKAWEYLNNNKKGINYKNLAQYKAEKDQ